MLTTCWLRKNIIRTLQASCIPSLITSLFRERTEFCLVLLPMYVSKSNILFVLPGFEIFINIMIFNDCFEDFYSLSCLQNSAMLMSVTISSRSLLQSMFLNGYATLYFPSVLLVGIRVMILTVLILSTLLL